MLATPDEKKQREKAIKLLIAKWVLNQGLKQKALNLSKLHPEIKIRKKS